MKYPVMFIIYVRKKDESIEMSHFQVDSSINIVKKGV